MKRSFYLCLALLVPGCSTPSGDLARAVLADRGASALTARMALRYLGARREPAAFWATIANDETYPTERRRIAVVQLFRRHIRVGMSIAEIARQLDGAKWLTPGCVRKVGAIAGWVPVKMKAGDTVLEVEVLRTKTAEIDLPVVYLRLSGHVSAEVFTRALRSEPVEGWVLRSRVRELAVVRWELGPEGLRRADDGGTGARFLYSRTLPWAPEAFEYDADCNVTFDGT